MLKDLKLFERRIPSKINMAGNVAGDVIAFLKNIYGPIEDNVIFDLRIVLNELILNAIKHGNKEDASKQVIVTARLRDQCTALITVEDSGEGYKYGCCKDIEEIRKTDFVDLKETGRGMLIVNGLCDKVTFNCKGNRVEILKELRGRQ